MSVTQEQVNNIIRHAGTFVGGALALAGTLAVLSATQVVDAQAALQDIIAGLSQAWGGFWKLGIVIGPTIALVMGKWGWHVVSPGVMATTVSQTLPSGSVKVIATPEAPAAIRVVAEDKSEATKNVEMSPPTVVIDNKPDAKPAGRGSSPR
jgi:hypothetical protein